MHISPARIFQEITSTPGGKLSGSGGGSSSVIGVVTSPPSGGSGGGSSGGSGVGVGVRLGVVTGGVGSGLGVGLRGGSTVTFGLMENQKVQKFQRKSGATYRGERLLSDEISGGVVVTHNCTRQITSL